jgi:hypothetical protein
MSYAVIFNIVIAAYWLLVAAYRGFNEDKAGFERALLLSLGFGILFKLNEFLP